MSCTSRVPYHQNVYDLLQFELLQPEPGESPEAARMIAEHETKHGPLPVAVREWYLVPDVVRLEPVPADRAGDELLNAGKLWWEFSNAGVPEPLANVLAQFGTIEDRPGNRYVQLDQDYYVGYGCWLEVTGTDNPPVWGDNCGARDPREWYLLAETFSEFIALTITTSYTNVNVPYSFNGPRARERGEKPFPKPYANGLWLRAPAEPFEVAAIDFLIERLDEPEQTPRPGNVTTYTFRPPGGILRVTADEPGLSGGLSAWWIHAETPERLAELVRRVLPFGTLRESLRADTDAGRRVLQALRSG